MNMSIAATRTEFCESFSEETICSEDSELSSEEFICLDKPVITEFVIEFN